MFKKYWQRGFDGLASLSLLGMVFLSAYSLESTHWTENLNLVTSLACIGVILGIALGVSSFQKKQLGCLIILYSLIMLFLFLIVMPSGSDIWSESWQIIFHRAGQALGALLKEQPVADNILFILLTGVSYWFISLWAGLALTRKQNPWFPLGLLAASTVATQFFQPTSYRSDFLSVVFFFLFLFLLGRLNYLTVQKDWKKHSAYEDPESKPVFLRTTAILSVLLVVIAWGIPFLINVATPGTKQHKAFIQTIEEGDDFFSNFFSSFQTRPIQKETVYGDTFKLGSSQPLGEEVLLTVITPSDDFYAGNYYWKARSYSTYQDGIWSSIDVEGQTLEANSRVALQNEAQNTTGKFVMVANAELNYYYLPGTTLQVNKPARISEMFKDTDDYDVIAWKPLLPIKENEAYQSESYFIPLTIEMLQNAGDNYPARIERVYLQLPEDFSERFHMLAEAITDGLDSDFEKTLAITDYLREQMIYSTEMGEISENLDPVFWFLFEGKNGTCNYYASAEVLMLRSIGIPARLGVGYAQGVEIEKNKVFEVRSKDSHAWPEVYFPHVGWVIFEPTSAQPAVQFSSENEMLNEPVENGERSGNQTGLTEQSSPPSGGRSNAWYDAIEKRLANEENLYNVGYAKSSRNWAIAWIIPLFVAGLLIFLFFGNIRYMGKRIPFPHYLVLASEQKGKRMPHWFMRWADRRNLTYVQRNFSQFDLILSCYGIENLAQRTPFEKAKMLQERVPSARESIRTIVQAYQQEVFGKQNADGRGMRKCFRTLRKEALLALVDFQFKRLWKRSKRT
jgi:transglutaminase-like putative cysteine protease